MKLRPNVFLGLDEALMIRKIIESKPVREKLEKLLKLPSFIQDVSVSNSDNN